MKILLVLMFMMILPIIRAYGQTMFEKGITDLPPIYNSISNSWISNTLVPQVNSLKFAGAQ